MKKYYQIPEIEVIAMVTSKCFLEDSGEIGSGGNIANQDKTFDADDVSLDISGSPSSLW